MDTVQHESAGGIIKGQDGRVVIVQQHTNSWSFPKGHTEEGETLLQTALREIEEETGLTELTFVQELGSYERYSIGKDGIGEVKEWGLKRIHFFLFTTTQLELKARADGEITEVRYVTPEEALELLTHPKDKEFLQSVWDTIVS
jgi:8-oxo-dGTP pyrophosphatase MutT (NUDIX family)